MDRQRGKVGRPRRKAKAIDPIMAEQAILNKTGTASDCIEDELLRCMTASDICAQALDYLTAIEIIRTKSGRLQSGLIGDLRRRVQGLEGFVRTLQIRAEATGDPQALHLRIEEFIKEVKEYKKDKERRKREVSDLQEVIRDLRKENKEIREEMRKSFKEIRDSIEKDVHSSNVHGNVSKDVQRNVNKDVYNHVNMDVHSHENKEDTPLPQRVRKNRGNNLIAANPELNPAEWPALKNHVNPEYKRDWVLRPSLQGKQTPIPVREDLYSATIKSTNTLNDNVPTMIFTGKTKAESKSLRTDIRVKENIQIAPPYSERNAPPVYSANQVPPPPPQQTNQEWVEIGRRGRKVKEGNQRKDTRKNKDGGKGKPDVGKEKRRLPKTAAICIKGSGDTFSYTEALKKIRTEISLKDLDIQIPKIRKGLSGSTIIDIRRE